MLDEAGVNVTAVNITGRVLPLACDRRDQAVAGRRQNAITAALSVADMKHVTVVDHDIDVSLITSMRNGRLQPGYKPTGTW